MFRQFTKNSIKSFS